MCGWRPGKGGAHMADEGEGEGAAHRGRHNVCRAHAQRPQQRLLRSAASAMHQPCVSRASAGAAPCARRGASRSSAVRSEWRNPQPRCTLAERILWRSRQTRRFLAAGAPITTVHKDNEIVDSNYIDSSINTKSSFISRWIVILYCLADQRHTPNHAFKRHRMPCQSCAPNNNRHMGSMKRPKRTVD